MFEKKERDVIELELRSGRIPAAYCSRFYRRREIVVLSVAEGIVYVLFLIC